MKALFALPLLLLPCLPLSAEPIFQPQSERVWAGEILWRDDCTVSFPFTNVGDEPLTIAGVRPSCGCVSVDFPRNAIAPGASGVITATISGDVLGSFQRDLMVYCHEPEARRLVIEGRIVTEQSTAARQESFPVDLGSVRMTTNVIEFSDVTRGEFPQVSFALANMRKEEFCPQLMHLPQCLTAVFSPDTIRGGGTGRVTLTLDGDKLMTDGLNQWSIYMARYPGDKVSRDNEIVVAAVRLPIFANLTDDERARAPRLSITDEAGLPLDRIALSPGVSKLGKKKGAASCTLLAQNTGDTELLVTALQVMGTATSVSLDSRTIPPHGKAKMKVKVDLSRLPLEKIPPRLLIISNDPEHAKTLLDVDVEGQ